MNPGAYQDMAAHEAAHWWFVARRKIIAQKLSELGLPPDADILEIGCGTGGNITMLERFGRVYAIEMNEEARDIAQARSGSAVIRSGCCPDDLPFQPNSFDLVCMFDVLEHIEHDAETLARVRGLLKPNGQLLITVPAYQWLYGSHDVYLHHKRRYRLGQLVEKVAVAGFAVKGASYFNFLLFPVVVIVRLKEKLLRKLKPVSMQPPPPVINALLTGVFGLERYVLKYARLPFGLSLMCVGKVIEHE